MIRHELNIYRRFHCTAGDCPLTCCEGWDIEVDSATKTRYEEMIVEGEPVAKNLVPFENEQGEQSFCFRSENYCSSGGRCPYFDEEGLCSLVKQFGDEALSETCRDFPRIYNEGKEFGETERTLTCACPAVLDLIAEVGKNERIMMVNPIPDFYLRAKLLKAYDETIDKLKGEEQDALAKGLPIPENAKAPASEAMAGIYTRLHRRYRNADPADDEFAVHIAAARSANFKRIEKFEDYCRMNEICTELFLAVSENYCEVPAYRYILADAVDYAKNMKPEDGYEKWNQFMDGCHELDGFFMNTWRAKLVEYCTENNEKVELQILEVLLLEFAMVRQLSMINLLAGISDMAFEDVRDAIVVFSRILGSNPSGVKEFMEQQFGNEVWTPEYALIVMGLTL